MRWPQEEHVAPSGAHGEEAAEGRFALTGYARGLGIGGLACLLVVFAGSLSLIAVIAIIAAARGLTRGREAVVARRVASVAATMLVAPALLVTPRLHVAPALFVFFVLRAVPHDALIYLHIISWLSRVVAAALYGFLLARDIGRVSGFLGTWTGFALLQVSSLVAGLLLTLGLWGLMGEFLFFPVDVVVPALVFGVPPILIGLLPGHIAKKKGYNFWLWWLFGAMLFIVALPWALIMSPNPLVKKRCPKCTSWVNREATACPYCGATLEASGRLARKLVEKKLHVGRKTVPMLEECIDCLETLPKNRTSESVQQLIRELYKQKRQLELTSAFNRPAPRNEPSASSRRMQKHSAAMQSETSAAKIRVRCSACGANLKAPERKRGETAKCPRCGARVDIPFGAPPFDEDNE